MSPGKKDTKAEIENMKYVLDNRIKILDESLKDINELLAEGEALLGKDFRAICNKIVKISYEYKISVQLNLSTYGSKFVPNKNNPIVFESKQQQDDFGKRINEVIKEIEKHLIPILNRPRIK